MITITITFLIALLSAFIIILMKKWGVTEYVQVHGNDFFAKMFSCDFCLSFWTAIIITIALFAVTGVYHVLFVPFFSTPITRILV